MGYVGIQTTNSFSRQPSKQDFTGSSGSSITLSHAVACPEDISLYINHVRQEPTTSYTVAGTTVSFVGYSISATDDVYVTHNALVLQTVVPPDSSVTNAKLVDGSIATAKLADDAVTRAKMADDLSGTNLAIDTTSSTFKMTDVSSNAFYRAGSFDVTDASGAGLTLTQTRQGNYIRIGDLVYVNFYVTYPTNSNSSGATIGGLPFQAASAEGFHYLAGRIEAYGAADVRVQIQEGTTTGLPQQNNTGLTNAQLTGRYVIMSGCYIAQSGT